MLCVCELLQNSKKEKERQEAELEKAEFSKNLLGVVIAKKIRRNTRRDKTNAIITVDILESAVLYFFCVSSFVLILFFCFTKKRIENISFVMYLCVCVRLWRDLLVLQVKLIL